MLAWLKNADVETEASPLAFQKGDWRGWEARKVWLKLSPLLLWQLGHRLGPWAGSLSSGS